MVCPRKAQILPLGLNRAGSKGRVVVHGQQVAEHGIAGCYVGLSYSFFQVWPGADPLIALLPRLRADKVVVIPLATLEAVAELRPVLEAPGLQVSLMQLQVSQGMPLDGGTRLAPLNPVVVLRGCRV